MIVPPGSVVDTTSDPHWTPTRVTARLGQPIVGLPRDPMHLDGPAQWCGYLTAVDAGTRLPPLGEWVHDFTAPMATWTAPCTRPDPDPRLLAADGASMWGWACSAAHYQIARHDTVHIRRRPACDQMTVWTTAASHHLGLGPRRAVNAAQQATWAPTLTWWCLADPPKLRALLARLTNVGRLARHGWGQILSLDVDPDEEAAHRWTARSWPDPAGRPDTARAPYWHPSRRMLCSSTRPA